MDSQLVDIEGVAGAIGVFEPQAAAWSLDGVPRGFSFGKLPPDWDRMEPNRKVRKQGLEHFIKFVRELPAPSPPAMFQALEGTSPGIAAAAATVLIVCTVVPVALVYRLLRRHELSML